MRLDHLKSSKQQAALFSFSPMTGAIIAYCGGKDYSSSQYDRVTQAIRPPGSAFKPIVYAAAVHKGWMPTDPVEDSPVIIGEWAPRNYGDKYKGLMPLYKALAFSSNVIYGSKRVLKFTTSVTPCSFSQIKSSGAGWAERDI